MAATKSLGRLVIDLLLRTAGFEQGATKASKQMEGLRRQGDDLAKSLTHLAAQWLSFGAVVASVAKGMRLGEELAETSEQLGITTEALSAMRHAARLTGVESAQLETSLTKMSRGIAEAATGSGAAADALEKLGLSAAELNRLSPDEQFRRIAAELDKISLAGDRSAIAFDIFGRNQGILRTLNLGAEGLAKAAEEAERFGLAITGIEAKQIDEAGDAIDRMKSASEGLSLTLASNFAPAIEAAANNLTDLLVGIRNFIDATSFLDEMAFGFETPIETLSKSEIGPRIELISDQLRIWNAELEKLKEGGRAVDLFGTATAHAEEKVASLTARLAALEGRRTQLESDTGPVSRRDPADALRSLQETDRELTRILEKQFDAANQQQKGIDAALEGIFTREQAEIAAALEREKLREQELQSVVDFFKTREQIEIEAFARRAEIIRKSTEEGSIEQEALLDANARARADRIVELEEETQARINQAVLDGSATRAQIEKASGNLRARAVFAQLDMMTQGIATHSKAAFAINKAAAIAGAILKAKESVVDAYEFGTKYGGPALGAVMAAIAAAATAAQVNAIRSTSFGSGSTPSAVGTTPTLNGQPIPDRGPGTDTARPASPPIIEIVVHGSILTDDALKSKLSELFDSDNVMIGSNTRQSAVIRSGNQ